MAPKSFSQRLVLWGVDELLVKYPGLRLAPAEGKAVKFTGILNFVAEATGKERIGDGYQLELSIPYGFPEQIPLVRETGGRIPPSYHKLDNGALCLGSPTRLRLTLTESPSIIRFVERCLIPYLYGHSYFERYHSLPFAELKHGKDGLLQDLASLIGTEREDIIPEFVWLTAMKKRLANRQRCPCGSQRRLGRCHHRRINAIRDRLGRSWFRILYYELTEGGGRALRTPRAR